MQQTLLLIVLSPLLAAVVVGLLQARLPRWLAHGLPIAGVGLACALSVKVLWWLMTDQIAVFNDNIYTWLSVAGLSFQIGFLVDGLTALMMVVVTFVSLMVHIYTIGYMREDPGYARFFAYISLFTFAMLMLVMANNFLQLFFAWEAVGLVSYLLIGFWYQRSSAVHANLKAFLVNRVGDFGFLLAIAAVLAVFGTLDYAVVFAAAPAQADAQLSLGDWGTWPLMTTLCVLLFIGAMGKSAQVPLHVWLPDSMEGPTPISALIHAATMVTAGIFMVARMSPLFELSPTAQSTILVIGAVTALALGLVGLVQTDIKRVVAYSTLSQLGYMTVALGASAYSVAIFHLMTHAFFKALLFLAAGSVIIAMHHRQDLRDMGGLRKYMPITFITAWAGTLALVGFPGTSGFFSKDLIIEAVADSERWGAGFAYICVLLGVLVTAGYSFRLLFLAFYGDCRADEHTRAGLKESPWVVTVPMVLLALPSLFIGWLSIETVVFGDLLAEAITVAPANDVVARLGADFHGPASMLGHAFVTPVLYLMLAGGGLCWWFYIRQPGVPAALRQRLGPLVRLLENGYYLDALYQRVFVRGAQGTGRALSLIGERWLIDGALVNGAARVVGLFAGWVRGVQSGYLYHYAIFMLLGLISLLAFLLLA